MTTPPSGPPPREFWLRQYSQDGGMYSDIRVMKPSDCDLGVSPPPGHDNLKYYDEVHVIEKSYADRLAAERDFCKAQWEHASKEVERLKAQDLTHAVLAADIKLREERDALAAKLKVARGALEGVVKIPTRPTSMTDAETQLHKIEVAARQALAEIGDVK